MNESGAVQPKLTTMVLAMAAVLLAMYVVRYGAQSFFLFAAVRSHLMLATLLVGAFIVVVLLSPPDARQGTARVVVVSCAAFLVFVVLGVALDALEYVLYEIAYQVALSTACTTLLHCALWLLLFWIGCRLIVKTPRSKTQTLWLLLIVGAVLAVVACTVVADIIGYQASAAMMAGDVSMLDMLTYQEPIIVTITDQLSFLLWWVLSLVSVAAFLNSEKAPLTPSTSEQ